VDETDFIKTKFSSLPKKISYKARWRTPKAPQGNEYNPLGAQGGVIDPSSHQRAADIKEKHREEVYGRRESSCFLEDGLG
jgi:hypothetical protein